MNTRLSHRQAVAATALVALAAAGAFMATSHSASGQPDDKTVARDKVGEKPAEGLEQVTFGSGCFWCTEAVFAELKGVKSAVSGYSGGHVEKPTYEQVCTGATGHAEVIQVTYDPKVVKFSDLLAVFWQTHDPTTLNRQGADSGTQYRSAIFYHTDEQRKEAEFYKKKLDESGAFRAPIVTEITKFDKFYPAENYHQEYYAANPEASYCRMVIAPKMEKFRKAFANMLKTEDDDDEPDASSDIAFGEPASASERRRNRPRRAWRRSRKSRLGQGRLAQTPDGQRIRDHAHGRHRARVHGRILGLL